MHERASDLALGWDRSTFDCEDCVGRGVIDLGALLPLDFPFDLDPFPLPFLPWTLHTPQTPIDSHAIRRLHETRWVPPTRHSWLWA